MTQLSNHTNDAEQLLDIRREIDSIDDRLLELINRRAACAQKVAEIKMAAGELDCFHRPEREVEVMRRMMDNNQGPLSRKAIARFYRELMSECLALEKPLTVAYLGPEGTFTQQAAFKHFGHAINGTPLASIDEIFRTVESGACQYGVVPVENSTEGVITHTLDSLQHTSLQIAGEISLRIHHNLMSKASKRSDIRKVLSHQQSLGQCRNWLDHHLPNAERIAVSSNSEAAKLVVTMDHAAAIAPVTAAELYGLTIIDHNIEDEANNTTRFLVVGRSGVGITGNDKTSLMMTMKNDPGALYGVLEPFARHRISLSKIESRPSRRQAWDYIFFIDAEGHYQNESLARVLSELEPNVTMVKVLGSYPKALV
jgi:chorismate mutase/prephenate dehydratase